MSGDSVEIWIENKATGKNIAGIHTEVYLLRRDIKGKEERIDISSLVRKADVRLHIGEPVTAVLECFITGLASRAELEMVFVDDLRGKRRGLWRRFRDISTFGSHGVKEYV